MGDQFRALSRGRHQAADRSRHFGSVVDDRSKVRPLAEAAGASMLAGQFLDFLDPWGNRIEVVEYGDLQFAKTPGVLRPMGLHLQIILQAQNEIGDKGMA